MTHCPTHERTHLPGESCVQHDPIESAPSRAGCYYLSDSDHDTLRTSCERCLNFLADAMLKAEQEGDEKMVRRFAWCIERTERALRTLESEPIKEI